MAGRATGRPLFFPTEPDEPMSTKKNTKKPAEVEAVGAVLGRAGSAVLQALTGR
jgi:hypothetical protein